MICRGDALDDVLGEAMLALVFVKTSHEITKEISLNGG